MASLVEEKALTVVSAAGLDAAPPVVYDDYDPNSAGAGDEDGEPDSRFAHNLFKGYPEAKDFDVNSVVLNREAMPKSSDAQAASVFTFVGRHILSPITKKPIAMRTFILRNVKMPFLFRPKSVPGAEKDDISRVKGLYQAEDGSFHVPGSTFGLDALLEGVVSLDEANRDDIRVLAALDARLRQLAFNQRKAMFSKWEHLKKPDDMSIVLNALGETSAGYSSVNFRVRMRGWSGAIESATTKIVTARRDGSRAAVVDDVKWKYPRQDYVEPPPLQKDATEIVMNVRDPLTKIAAGITTLTPARVGNKIISVDPLEKLPNGKLAFRRVNPADLEGVYGDVLVQITAICTNGLTAWTCANVLAVAFDPEGPKANPHHASFSSITTAPQTAVMAMIGAETHRLRQAMGIAAPSRPLLKDAPRRAQLLALPVSGYSEAAPRGGVSAAAAARAQFPARFSAKSTPIVVSDNDEEADDAAAAARADAFFASTEAAAAASSASGGGAGSKRRAQDAMGGVEARVTLTVGGETGFGSPAALLGLDAERDFPPPPAPEKIKRARRTDEDAEEVLPVRVLDYSAAGAGAGTGEGAGDEQD